jgi:acyl-CoA synthetase (NDP forming)
MLERSAAQFDPKTLDHIFKPRTVAIVGASPERGTPRNSIVRVLLQTGFPGTIYLIHPRHREVEGLKCYPDLASLPEVPDLALVITPSQTVSGIIEDCGEKGVPAAVVFSSGFEEMEEGKALAAELLETANRCGVALLGANCQGAWSIRDKVVLSFGSAALQLKELKHSPVAIVSQSGALAGAIGFQLQTTGIGCSYMVSVGNETQLDILDYLSWIVAQDNVRVVVLYVEGFRDGSRLLDISERARANGVQIVALKSGNSSLGQSATASHTGKIASPHAIYRDVLDQAGIIAVEALADVLAIIETFIYLPRPRLSGDPKGGTSALSISGGACALLADHAEQRAVPMAEFSPKYAKALEELFPAFARSANPADMTGAVRSQPGLLDDSLALMSDDPRTEAFIMQFSSSGKRDLDEKGTLFKAVAQDKQLPVILSFAGEQPSAELRKEYRESGVLFCQDPAATIKALDWIYKRERYAARPAADMRPLPATHPAPRDWSETITVLADCGVGAPGWRVLGPADTAADACAGLSYPLVVKVLPSDADHKTELGLVKLCVSSPQEVDEHAASFRKVLNKPDAGILVQEMIDGGVEVVLSCLRKTDFGPILTVGLGGMGIELFRDVAHLALPVDERSVRNALKTLKLWALLEGFRGKPRADIEALVGAAVKFGDMFLAMPDLQEFEVNPLMVLPAGEGVSAVDALVSMAAAERTEHF